MEIVRVQCHPRVPIEQSIRLRDGKGDVMRAAGTDGRHGEAAVLLLELGETAWKE